MQDKRKKIRLWTIVNCPQAGFYFSALSLSPTSGPNSDDPGNIRVNRMLSRTSLPLIADEITRVSVVHLHHVYILSAVQAEEDGGHTAHFNEQEYTWGEEEALLCWRSNGNHNEECVCLLRQCVCVFVSVCMEAVGLELDKEQSPKSLPSPCPHSPHIYTPPAPKPLGSHCWPSCLKLGDHPPPAPRSQTHTEPHREKKEAFGAHSTVSDVNRLTTVTSDPKTRGDGRTVALTSPPEVTCVYEHFH